MKVDKFNNTLEAYPSCASDTLVGCFTMYLFGNDTYNERISLRAKLVERMDPEDAQQNKRVGFVSSVKLFCTLVSDMYSVTIHIGDRVYGSGMSTMYILKSDEGRFILLRVKRDMKQAHGPHTFDLWSHVEPGKAVKVMKLTPPSVPGYECHWCTPVPATTLFSIIPNGKLWREVLQDPNDTLYVYCGTTLVATQVYHGKTNPYFYLVAGQLVVLIAKSEQHALASLREFNALVHSGI
jgi:hypothetical protein